MKPYWQQDGNKIYQGDALGVLKTMPDESIHCCVTSPPYWGLRDYGVEDQLGLEKTPEEYIEKMVNIFREVRRVLRPDGTLWLNLGDSYIGGGRAGKGEYKNKHINMGKYQHMSTYTDPSPIPKNLKPKDLCGIPWRLALALQADCWWLRSAVPWVKRSAMPESCSDRPASALEYFFLLTKSAKYFFDMDAIRKESIDGYRINPNKNPRTGRKAQSSGMWRGCGDRKEQVERDVNFTDTSYDKTHNRNFRNTDLFFESLEPPFGAIFADDELVGLDINPKGFSAAHFATFPPRLPEVAILAGTSEKGCCAKCGAPWERIIEKNKIPRNELPKTDSRYRPNRYIKNKYADELREGYECGMYSESKTTGWEPTCKCESDIKPCVVLDPFGGAMTTAIVAHKHGQRFTMIELSKTYIDDIGIPRIEKETRQLKLFRI